MCAALRDVGSGLLISESPLRYFGIELGRRMAVIRLPGGKLFVHSPCPLTATLREELDRLGTVGFVVPASSLHGHLHMEDYQGAYPHARIYAAPGLERRRPLTL